MDRIGLAIGESVWDASGYYVGRVDEIDERGFRITGSAGTFWVRNEVIFLHLPDRVELICNLSHITDYAFQP